MKLAYKLLALILSVSAFTLILSNCAATEDTAARLSPLEQALADSVTVELSSGNTDLELATAVSIDTANSTGTITITGDLANACAAASPCANAAAGTLATLTITKDDPAFTFAASTFSFNIPTDAPGAQTTNVTTNLPITNLADDSTIDIDIIVEYSGYPVAELVTNNDITRLISAEFASRDLSIALNDAGDTIALSGTNADNGTAGSITTNNLPTGYTATLAGGATYTFADPDDEETAAEDFTLSDLLIAESDVDGNQKSYTVTLSLEAPSVLETVLDGAISVTSPAMADLSIDTATITITGLTNACSALPCDTAETATTFATLTIDEGDGSVFTVSSATPINIPDAAGAQTTTDTLTDALTINDGSTDITFDIVVEYSGQLVADLVTADNIDSVLPATVAFDGQDNNATNTWNDTGDTLTITGLYNPTGSGTEGSVSLTLADDFPTGYTIISNSLSFADPAGTNAADIPSNNAFSIAEGDGTTVINNNEASYDLVVVLSELPDVELDASDLDITVTNTLNSDIVSSISDIDISGTIVTIEAAAGVRNLDSTNLGLTDTDTGSVTIAAASGSTITMDETTLTFTDQAGTQTQTLDLGSFTASSNGATAPYTVSLVLAPSYNVRIGGDASTTTIAELESIDKNLDPCEIFTYSLFTLNGSDIETPVSATFSTTPASPSPYYDSVTTANNINNFTAFSATPTGGSAITYGSATITVQECDSFAGGTGADADNAYIIDNDMRLDLMSRLVNGDSVGTTYRDKHYTLTADIDLGLTNAPWADTTGNGFVPIGKRTNSTSGDGTYQKGRSFTGTLDCASNTISNLTISNTNNSDSAGYDGNNLGLFAATDTGAVITNCTLENANITGASGVGGLVGFMDGGSIGHSAVISSTISIGTGSTVGGLVGNLVDTSSISYSFAAASVTGGYFTGGLAGVSTSTIHNSYFIGSVTNTYTSGGGLTSGGVPYSAVTLSNVYVAATLTLVTTVNSFGLTSDNADVTNSYWDSTLYSATEGAGAGKTTSELQTPITATGIYADWSTDVWDFGTTSQYPTLKNLPLTAAEQRAAGAAALSP